MTGKPGVKIDRVNIHGVSLPFFGDFSHALKSGASADNIVVEIVAEGGRIRGYGEGAPRAYVTGETQETSIEAVRRMAVSPAFPWVLSGVPDIWAYLDGLKGGKEIHAARCALETALLDVFGKARGVSVMDFFPRDFYGPEVRYGAAVPLTHRERAMKIARVIRGMGIRRLKLKLGRDFHENREVLEGISAVFREGCDLKVDVNGAWDRDLAFRHIPLIRRFGVRIVEQPMPPGDGGLAAFARAMDAAGVILMADEAACSLEDVKMIVRQGWYRMINVRVSKCGGLRKSMQMINFLRRNRVLFQIACQLGESGLLSAAGRILSLLSRDARYHDGSYDEFLLKENITTKNVSFGPGGKAGPLGGHGLGVDVDRNRLLRLSNGPAPVTVARPA